MAQNPAGNPHRVVDLTRSAIRDLAVIYNYTEEQWSEAQAEDYQAFLETEMQELADNPARAPFVPNLNKVRSSIVRWHNARQGHRIFFEETEDGILILRVMHTAQNWSSRDFG